MQSSTLVMLANEFKNLENSSKSQNQATSDANQKHRSDVEEEGNSSIREENEGAKLAQFTEGC